VVWGCAAVAIVFTAIDFKKYSVFSMICYLAMGWCVIIFLPQTLDSMSLNGVILLVLGGIAYTIGSILYGIGKKMKYMHSVFHIFVVLGSILHFFAIIFYALPTR
jgi:hemolysin III